MSGTQPDPEPNGAPSRGAAAVVSHYTVLPSQLPAFAAVQAQLSAELSGQGDYLGSSETMSPVDGQQGTEVTVVRRFDTLAAARAWVTAGAGADALATALAGPATTTVLLEEAPAARATSVITSRVRPGSRDWFLARQAQMQAAQAQFPGYVGQRDQAPIPGVNPDWVTVVAFDTHEHLQAWLDSPQRAAFLADSAPHVEQYDVRPARAAFESWFREPQPVPGPPPAWKLNAVVLAVLYPIVMAEILWLYPHLGALGLSLSTFVGNVISVFVTGLILVPLAARALNWWLVPEQARARQVDWRGMVVLVGVYALSVALFRVVAGG